VNTNDATTLLERLLHRIAPEIDLGDIEHDEPLQDAADLDSMDFLNLVTALHAETGIDVPERDYRLVATIDGFVDYVVRATESRVS
jgi:acyl carrier protein